MSKTQEQNQMFYILVTNYQKMTFQKKFHPPIASKIMKDLELI